MPDAKKQFAPEDPEERFRAIKAETLSLLWPVVIGVIVAYLVYWSIIGLKFDFSHISVGIQRQLEQLGRMFPHNKADWNYDLKLSRDLFDPLITTIQMAISGTAVGALLAIPISFFVARTGYFPRPLSALFKTFLNIARSIPTLVYALIAVSFIGLGPSAGASALAFVTFISLAKMFAEGLETVSPGAIEAVRAAGGNGAQVFVFGMIPQVFPLYLSNMLYSLEYNIKDSFVFGIVGAGGLGYELMNKINLFEWLDAGVIIFFLIVLVNVVDYVSYLTRKAIA
jgi:phosphonate transport system permease protein